jgi:hypothetical protein
MKTQETLKIALKKYEEENDKIDHKLDVIEKILDGDFRTTNVQNVSFDDSKRLCTFASEKQELKEQKKEIDFKIRFTKWVLE